MNRLAWQVLAVAVVLGSTGKAQVTRRVSVATSGGQGNGTSADLYGTSGNVISADGRYVCFESYSTNLVPGDTNGVWDVFVRDVLRGTTERVSVSTGGTQGNYESEDPSISADGRFVAFTSDSTNLVPGDTNGAWDVFVHDRQNGVTERISVATGGAQGNDTSNLACISGDGRYVAFGSYASNLVPGDSNGFGDIFVRDRQSGTTELVSIASGGTQGDETSYIPCISADGRFVAFSSQARNLVPGDTNGMFDVFVHDRQSGTTERVSVGSGGTQANGDSGIIGAMDFGLSISADGRLVAFASTAMNLVPGFGNPDCAIFVHDRWSGATECVSVDSNGRQGNGGCALPSISSDGRFVGFMSSADNLVPGDTNHHADVFVHDRRSGATERVSIATDTTQGNADSFRPGLTPDGRFVAFGSYASSLVGGDTNGAGDTFVHDRNATGFTDMCDPGVGGVITCPCSNQPAGSGQGCDNSAATGGAVLSASGIGYLSLDSLVFTASGERPTATSILLQGDALVANGIVYGQGVRCVGGTLKRLFVKTAVAGSVTAPDFGAGDPTVSTRSAARGDVIQPGQSRWYLIYYRDPVVLGGCPASSTFNSTQTGRVDWLP